MTFKDLIVILLEIGSLRTFHGNCVHDLVMKIVMEAQSSGLYGRLFCVVVFVVRMYHGPAQKFGPTLEAKLSLEHCVSTQR